MIIAGACALGSCVWVTSEIISSGWNYSLFWRQKPPTCWHKILTRWSKLQMIHWFCIQLVRWQHQVGSHPSYKSFVFIKKALPPLSNSSILLFQMSAQWLHAMELHSASVSSCLLRFLSPMFVSGCRFGHIKYLRCWKVFTILVLWLIIAPRHDGCVHLVLAFTWFSAV